MINTESLNLVHRRRKEDEEGKNDELEASEHLRENHRIRILTERTKKLHMNKSILD